MPDKQLVNDTNNLMVYNLASTESVSDQGLTYLTNIKICDIGDDPDAQAKLQACVNTLYKIISNIIAEPNEIKFRKLSRSNENLRTKVLAYPNAIEFLKLAGFQF